jgi:hypothetical protein
MTWQEYQQAVAELYKQTARFGKIEHDVRLPDLDTGGLRQIDVLWTIQDGGHTLRTIVDAKYRKEPLDVKDVEEICSLRGAVGADKAIIVALNGWGDPAEKKAKRLSMDLRILSLVDALDLIVPDKWVMCPKCHLDCIVMDQDGFITSPDQLIIWWLAGQCRHCSHARIHCQDCGTKFYLDMDQRTHCYCGYEWTVDEFGIGIEA